MKNPPNSSLEFYKHLLANAYSNEIAHYYNYNVYYYLQWLKKRQLQIAQVSYKNLMDYIGYLQDVQHKSTPTINKHLRAITCYYEYLVLPNIAANVRLKGVKKHQSLFLKEQEMELLYKHYNQDASTTYFKHSNKLLLGLMIYQNLEIHDFLALRLTHLNLEKGTLYVPSGKHLKNSRTLALQAHQIIPLHQYITKHRNTKNSLKEDFLFLPQALKKSTFKQQCGLLHKELVVQAKSQGIPYQSLRQLRQSRIVLWIKHYGLRQAQYLSGHKGIYSIERYRQQDIEDLSKQIQMFHPLQ